MAENPLLPNAELRALYSLLKHAATETEPTSTSNRKRSRAESPPSSAALLAGTLLQLRSGDLLISSAEEQARSAALLALANPKRNAKRASALQLEEGSARLMLAAGLASGLRRSGQDRLVLAFTGSGSREPQWADAMAWAQGELLPLVLVCADPSGPDAFREAPATEPDVLEWTRFQRAAGKLKLPVLSVDGEDAVAVYRVMQESVLRARAGGGPAVLWAVLPTPKKGRSSGSTSPSVLQRLEQYMRARKISFS